VTDDRQQDRPGTEECVVIGEFACVTRAIPPNDPSNFSHRLTLPNTGRL